MFKLVDTMIIIFVIEVLCVIIFLIGGIIFSIVGQD